MGRLGGTAMTPTHVICPKCETKLAVAPGIGPFCPNRDCDVVDGVMQAAGLAPEIKTKTKPNWEDLGPRMLEALRPLGALADFYEGTLNNDDVVIISVGPPKGIFNFTVGHCRQARALIKEAEERS